MSQYFNKQSSFLPEIENEYVVILEKTAVKTEFHKLTWRDKIQTLFYIADSDCTNQLQRKFMTSFHTEILN
ncbi:hypothetical protein Glove_109g137 [Diversispora epigaea]|uniref:Uncharacterized protein n=1 Tax=Diversispora epigaea TaxID=1348612 RepID=A0A397J2J5_9GLOM|nr:hypothetical protein Glove_109g137 [Diversispora epigaea]